MNNDLKNSLRHNYPLYKLFIYFDKYLLHYLNLFCPIVTPLSINQAMPVQTSNKTYQISLQNFLKDFL